MKPIWYHFYPSLQQRCQFPPGTGHWWCHTLASCPPVSAAHWGSHWTLWCWWLVLVQQLPCPVPVSGASCTPHMCPHCAAHLTSPPRLGFPTVPARVAMLAMAPPQRQVSSLCLWIKPITKQSTLGTLCKQNQAKTLDTMSHDHMFHSHLHLVSWCPVETELAAGSLHVPAVCCQGNRWFNLYSGWDWAGGWLGTKQLGF